MRSTILLALGMSLLAGCDGRRDPAPTETVWPSAPGWHRLPDPARLPTALSFDGVQPWLWLLEGDRLIPVGPGAGKPLTLDRPARDVEVTTDPSGPRLALLDDRGRVWEGRPGAMSLTLQGAASLAPRLPRALYVALDGDGRVLSGPGGASSPGLHGRRGDRPALSGPGGASSLGLPGRRGDDRLRVDVEGGVPKLRFSSTHGTLRSVVVRGIHGARAASVLGRDERNRSWLLVDDRTAILVDRFGTIEQQEALGPGPRRLAVDGAGRLALAEADGNGARLRLFVPRL